MSSGSETVTLRTRHGSFSFVRCRLRDRAGQEVRLPGFLPSNSGLLSAALRQCVLFWVNRLSFGDVSLLVEQMTGERLLSEDALWRLSQQEAARLDAAQKQKIEDGQALTEPEYVAPAEAAVYEAVSVAPEFVTMTDGIGVKAQKPTRQKADQERAAKEQKRHDTDVLILPRQDGSEEIVCEGVSGRWTLVEAARAFLCREWTGKTLPVVALTDGARTIRADLTALFGERVRVILDWYHLAKRVYQNLSMVAHSMEEREQWEKRVLALLWRGNVAEAKDLLSGLMSVARKTRAMTDLISYLDKHASEIIDYERRQKAGKPIGSGRMEKCVDQVIGHRQKGKGMSWTQKGSRALALLKAAELNARTRRHDVASA